MSDNSPQSVRMQLDLTWQEAVPPAGVQAALAFAEASPYPADHELYERVFHD